MRVFGTAVTLISKLLERRYPLCLGFLNRNARNGVYLSALKPDGLLSILCAAVVSTTASKLIKLNCADVPDA